MPSDPARPYSGQYSDGQSAAVIAVSVTAGQDGLRIATPEGQAIIVWPWDRVGLVEKATQGRPIRLLNRSASGARLTFDHPAILPILESMAPNLARAPFGRKQIRTIALSVGIGAAVIGFMVFGLPLIAKPLAKLVPMAWEEQVGDDTIDVVNRMFAGGKKSCSNEKGLKALNDLARRLLAGTETPYRVRVSVANADMVNAFAVPGGRVVLFRGLIDKATSPEEVAGVLAHELAHVVYRHPTQGMITSVGWSAILSAFTGGASFSSEVVAQVAAHLATSAYSRDLETEADREGVVMLNRTGIGGGGLIKFFELIQKLEKKGISLPEYLSSHPITGSRIAAIGRISKPATAPALTETEWRTLRKICD